MPIGRFDAHFGSLLNQASVEPLTVRIPEIKDMNTVMRLRNNGIGTRMIRAAGQVVRQAGRRAIGVGMSPDYTSAQALYPKAG